MGETLEVVYDGIYDEYGIRIETERSVHVIHPFIPFVFCVWGGAGVAILNTTLRMDASSVKIALQSTTPTHLEYEESK